MIGRIVDKSTAKYHAFKGIPYAEPPIGKLRFQAPVPHKKWRGVREALEHGNFCANRFGFVGVEPSKGGNEDCLFLNVYTPSISGKRPVMVFFHGGSFSSGNGDTSLYGPDHLVKENVVLVTVNYRLSAFGFLSTGDQFAPGNAGLKDLVMALKWVKLNIKKFGGDPNRVTIFGQSAGSNAVHYLLISDMANGLFSKAIMQSGSSLSPCCFRSNPKEMAEKLGQRLNLTFNTSEELIQKLTAVDFKKIIEVETPLFSQPFPWGMRPLEFVPTAEPKGTKDAFLTEEPIERMLNGKFKKTPLIVGSPSFEAMSFIFYYYANPDLLKILNSDPSFLIPISLKLGENSTEIEKVANQIRQVYFNGNNEGTVLEWLNIFSDYLFRAPDDRAARFSVESKQNDSPVYYYEFSFDGKLNFFKNFMKLHQFKGAGHCDELFFLFQPEIPGFEADERSSLMRRRMTKMWANFAKHG